MDCGSGITGGIATAKAYNIGIDLSKGRYLMLVNDDCCLEEKVAHRAVHFLETHPEFVGTGFSLLDLDGIRRPMKLHLYPFWPSSLDRPHSITFVGTNNLLCRREAFQTVGLFDENGQHEWQEDLLLQAASATGFLHSYPFSSSARSLVV